MLFAGHHDLSRTVTPFGDPLRIECIGRENKVFGGDLAPCPDSGLSTQKSSGLRTGFRRGRKKISAIAKQKNSENGVIGAGQGNYLVSFGLPRKACTQARKAGAFTLVHNENHTRAACSQVISVHSLTYFTARYTGGDESYLNATEDETIEFGTPKVGIEKYPDNYEYQWFLIVPEGRQVQIDFDIFELEDSENCKNDYLEIREADPVTMKGVRGPILTGRLCGSTMPSTIQSAGNVVWVQFVSNNNATTVYKGFRASFKAGLYKLGTSLNRKECQLPRSLSRVLHRL